MISSSLAQQSWTTQTSNTTNDLRSVDFVTANTGFTAGNTGTLRKTIDGGANWTTLTSGTTSNLWGIAMFNADTGLVVGAGGLVRKTINGGANWTSKTSGTTTILYDICNAGSKTFYACGGTGKVIKTINNGNNWTNKSPASVTQNLSAIYFVSPDTGWVVGGSGIVLKTVNGGSTWASQTSNTIQPLTGVCFSDKLHGYASGQGGTIIKTVDGGATWTNAAPVGIVVDIYAVYSLSDDTCYVVGGNGKIVRTNNGGVSWLYDVSNTTNNLYALDFPVSQIGFSVGFGGVIRKKNMQLNPYLVSGITDQTYNENSGTHVTVTDLNNIFDDLDTPILTFSTSVIGTFVTAAIVGTELQITTVANAHGICQVVVTATDDQPSSVSDTFNVTINPMNHAPVLTGIPDNTICSDGSSQVSLNSYVTDHESSPSQISFLSNVISVNPGSVPASALTISINASTHIATVTSTATATATFTVVFTAMDDSSAVSSDTANIKVSHIHATLSKVDLRCYGSTNGTAAITVSDGTSPYTYHWSHTISPLQAVTGLSAGNYSVTVSDNIGCDTVISFTITTPSALVAYISDQNNVLCNGGSDGSATVTVSGGTQNYTYAWNSIPPQTSATLSGVVSGTYNVTVVDANLCSTTSTVTIAQPTAPLIVIIIKNNEAYGGQCNGSVTALTTGGTTNYSYLWNNGNQTALADSLCPGNYTVTVTDANGCTSESMIVIHDSVVVATNELQGMSPDISVFPDPASEYFIVGFTLVDAAYVEITLMSLNGEEVNLSSGNMIAGLHQEMFDVKRMRLAKSLYILRININDQYFSAPVIIQ